MMTSRSLICLLENQNGGKLQKDNCERIVEILQKLLYNTRPLVLFDSLCELVSQNLWLGSKGYPNGLLL
jgi:hypothetical protein